MRSPIFLLGLTTVLGSVSNAHTIFTTFFVNDVNQGDGTCVRMDMNGNRATGPVRGVEDSPDMACGRDGQKAVAFTCPADAGDKLTFEYREWADYSQQGVIDSLHKGPAAIYIKQVSDMKSDSAAGDGWFKIWDEGYDSGAGLWATEKLIASKGLLSFNIPTGLPTGYYLFRTELLTFQNVTNNYVDPQFYIGCAQLFVRGAADAPALSIPADREVSIPGHVKLDDKSLHFNIYDQPLKLPYSTPGPKPFVPTLPGGDGSAPQIKAVAQTQGAVPPKCLVKNANWCGFEVPSYSTESGCWAALKNCYDQLDVCYKTFPPSGAKGCDRWDTDKCKVIDRACQDRQFTGPPNKDQKLKDASAPLPGPIPAARAVPKGDVVQGGGGGGVPEEDGGDDGSSTPPPSPSASVLPVEGGGEDGEGEGEASGDDNTPPPPASSVALPSSVYVELPVAPPTPSASATSVVSPGNGLPSTFSTVAVPSSTAKPSKACGGGNKLPLNYGYKTGRKGNGRK